MNLMNDYSTLLSLLSSLDEELGKLPCEQRLEAVQIMIDHLEDYQDGIDE